MEDKNNFENDKYSIIRNVINDNMLNYIKLQINQLEEILCFTNNVESSDYFFNDSQISTSFAYYSSLTSDSLLLFLKKTIENIVGKNLYPTYSYLRIYYKDSILNNHISWI